MSNLIDKRLNPVAVGRLISQLENLATEIEIRSNKPLPNSRRDSVNETGRAILNNLRMDLTMSE
jgi:hypothetical protein|tara:strand:- start:392 stop:583 length:192 start_codon:yes stop_codon:yes gene_type:complete